LPSSPAQAPPTYGLAPSLWVCLIGSFVGHSMLVGWAWYRFENRPAPVLAARIVGVVARSLAPPCPSSPEWPYVAQGPTWQGPDYDPDWCDTPGGQEFIERFDLTDLIIPKSLSLSDALANARLSATVRPLLRGRIRVEEVLGPARSKPSPAFVRRLLEKRVDLLRWCYTNRSKDTARLHGRMKLALSLVHYDTRARVTVRRSTLDNKAVEQCIANVLSDRMPFRARDDFTTATFVVRLVITAH